MSEGKGCRRPFAEFFTWLVIVSPLFLVSDP
jgi:hypothetical protein